MVCCLGIVKASDHTHEVASVAFRRGAVNAKELFDAGDLSAAIEQLNHDVRSRPTDTRQRTFLFELLCFAGDYQRAARQLDAIGHQSATADIGVQIYRNVLEAEASRQKLFTQGLRPHFLFPPPSYVQQHLEAMNRLRENRPAEAKALLEQAEQVRPQVPGQFEGQTFQDFRDVDDVLAPFLEIIMHNSYIWLPFDQIKQLIIPPPKHLRDLLWIPATVEAHLGPVGAVFLPVLYPGSSTHDNDQVKLGRMTDWQALGEGLARGCGQHLYLLDDSDRALLEIREIVFETEGSVAEDTQE
jgi:type VI secretion system protein ImpE